MITYSVLIYMAAMQKRNSEPAPKSASFFRSIARETRSNAPSKSSVQMNNFRRLNFAKLINALIRKMWSAQLLPDWYAVFSSAGLNHFLKRSNRVKSNHLYRSWTSVTGRKYFAILGEPLFLKRAVTTVRHHLTGKRALNNMTLKSSNTSGNKLLSILLIICGHQPSLVLFSFKSFDASFSSSISIGLSSSSTYWFLGNAVISIGSWASHLVKKWAAKSDDDGVTVLTDVGPPVWYH